MDFVILLLVKSSYDVWQAIVLGERHCLLAELYVLVPPRVIQRYLQGGRVT
jgi:hypothetical protein